MTRCVECRNTGDHKRDCSQRTTLPPLFWCASCRRRIDTLRGIVICQGHVHCGHDCHEHNHHHKEEP